MAKCVHISYIQGLNWMVSLHHNGLNGILAVEMVRSDSIYIPSITYSSHAGPQENSAIYLLPCLPQTLLRHLRSLSYRRPKIYITKLVSWIRKMDSWFQGHFAGGHQGRMSGNYCQSTYIPRLWGMCNGTKFILIEKSVLKKFSFEYILIDKAHCIKNVNSILSQIVRTFTSRGRLLIMGTPLQNSLKELFSLLNFICPEIFVDYKDLDSFLHKDSTNVEKNLSPSECSSYCWFHSSDFFIRKYLCWAHSDAA